MAGIRVVEIKRRGSDSVQFTEKVLRSGFNLRIEYPADSPYAGQIVVENRTRRLQFIPSRREIRQIPARGGEDLLPYIGGMRQRGKITFRTSDGGRVAGLATRLVEAVTPEGRTIQKLWIEERNAVILKKEVFEPSGDRVGYYEFRSVKFNPSIPSGAFELSIPGAKVVTLLDQLREAAGDLGLPAFRLGGGFDLSAVRKLDSERGRGVMAIYSDQNRRVTLFYARSQVDPKRIGQMSGGRFSSHAWTRDGINFVLFGDMPVSDLARLAETLTPATVSGASR